MIKLGVKLAFLLAIMKKILENGVKFLMRKLQHDDPDLYDAIKDILLEIDKMHKKGKNLLVAIKRLQALFGSRETNVLVQVLPFLKG